MFEDVADEERVHVGESSRCSAASTLRRRRGSRRAIWEVLELLGERAGGSGSAAGSQAGSSGVAGGAAGYPPGGGVVFLFLEALEVLWVLPRVPPVTGLGPGVGYAAEPRVVLSEQPGVEELGPEPGRLPVPGLGDGGPPRPQPEGRVLVLAQG